MIPTVHELGSGLTVILAESHAAPVVSYQAWVGVGSADEVPREAGLAHVLEHMLFKGTARRGVGEIARDVESAGGQINAWTSHDETVYHVTLASRFREQGLDIISDALTNASLDAGELARELEVIREEIRMGADTPQRVLAENLFASVFREHPYGRPVIGFDRTVSGFDRRVVERFYRKWYIPENVVFVASGDFDAPVMLRQITAAFADFQSPRRGRPRRRKAEPPQRRMRQRHVLRPVSEVQLALGYPIPGLTHDDVPALDLLSAIVGQGASSRLEKAVRRQRGLVSEIRAMAYTPRDSGMFAVFAATAPADLQRAVAAISEEIQRLGAGVPSPAEIEKARTMLESDSIYSEETVDGIARKLGFYRLHTGNEAHEEHYLARLARVGPEQLVEAARRYLLPGRVNAVTVLPDPAVAQLKAPWARGRGAKRAVDKARLRRAMSEAIRGERRRAGRPKRAGKRPSDGVAVFTLSSGDKLIVREEIGSRYAAARAAFLGGLRHERPAQAGLVSLLTNSMVRGTASRTANEISREMDTLACSVSGFGGRNTIGVHGEFLARNFNQGFALMSDCLRRPSFPSGEVDREKQLLLDDIRAGRDNPAQQAFERFRRALFGRHPYGRPIHGTAASVSRLSPASLTRFLEATTGPGRMVLAVVGGVAAEEVRELAERNLTIRANGRQRPRDPEPWKIPTRPRQVLHDLPREQSHVVVGFPGTTLDAEDRFPIEVISEMLGGHGGRLFARVRELEGLAYQVTATSLEGIERGFLAMYAATAPGHEERVVRSLLEEARRICETPPSAVELNRIKRHIAGTRDIARQRAAARAASMALGQVYGLGHDIDERHPRRILAVTAEQVRDTARRYLDEGRMVISCVGPAVERLRLI